jgi:hypothetical protein
MAKAELKRTTELIKAAIAILDVERPMTIRQLFYRLVSKGLVENSRASYQLVSRIMTKARNDGRCDFDFIVDRSRPEYRPTVWDDAEGYAKTVQRSYRKDYWAMQPNYVELWVEKDAIIGSIEPVTNELGIAVRVGRGFLSTTRVHEIADVFSTIPKPIVVYYLGDHDPSGRYIETDLYERIQQQGSGPFKLQRLAIFKSDIKAFHLPPLRVKQDDPRAAAFLRRHGTDCVELDALPPEELRSRIRTSVTKLIDHELWKRAVIVEKAELNSIRETVAKWPKGGLDPRRNSKSGTVSC